MASSTLSGSSPVVERPLTVMWAVFLVVATNVMFNVTFFVPGADDIPVAAIVVGTALSVVTIAFCWPLWQCKRWGAIAVTVISVLNMLTALPGLADPPSGTVAVIIIAAIPATLIPVWLIWHPASREAYRRS
jgi:hypothetical protein